jgi:hypothetical protein
MHKVIKNIQLGTWLELLIKVITFNNGEHIALWIAKKVFNKDTCGCCERKEWLNRLTNKDYNGNCGMIKL